MVTTTDRMKRNAMRTQATQTDRGQRNSAHISSPSGAPLPQKQPQFPPKVSPLSTLRHVSRQVVDPLCGKKSLKPLSFKSILRQDGEKETF